MGNPGAAGAAKGKVMIIAVGSAGGYIINQLVGRVETKLVAINTYSEVLQACDASIKLLIGAREFRGLGAGANPDIGARAAEDAAEAIAKLCIEPVILVAGLGGGTGTGAAPVVARIAKEQGCNVTAVVTWPFRFEGGGRHRQARDGLTALKAYVPRPVLVRLQKLLPLLPPRTPLRDAFAMGDKMAAQAVIDTISSKARMAMDAFRGRGARSEDESIKRHSLL